MTIVWSAPSLRGLQYCDGLEQLAVFNVNVSQGTLRLYEGDLVAAVSGLLDHAPIPTAKRLSANQVLAVKGSRL